MGLSGAVGPGMGLVADGGEGHVVTGVCGRALLLAAGTVAGAWVTGRRPGMIHALPRPAHQPTGAAYEHMYYNSEPKSRGG